MAIESDTALYERVKKGFSALGYTSELIRENYEFADVISPNVRLQTVPLATFFQDPPSYQNACFAVVFSNGLSGAPLVEQYRSLGAPQFLEITSTGIVRWGMPSQGNPKNLGNISPADIEKTFNDNRGKWSPSAMSRVKTLALGPQRAYQLDFFDIGLMPMLDRQVQVKLNRHWGRHEVPSSSRG